MKKYTAVLLPVLLISAATVAPAFGAIARPEPRVTIEASTPPSTETIVSSPNSVSDPELEARYQALLDKYPELKEAAEQSDLRWLLKEENGNLAEDTEAIEQIVRAIDDVNSSAIVIPDQITPEDPNAPTPEELRDIMKAKQWLDVKEDLELREVDQKALDLVKNFANTTTAVAPMPGQNGAVTYLYGEMIPRIVCRPNRVTDIALEPGEIVTAVHAGDTTRWSISPARSGSGSQEVVHVVIKPLMQDISTNLVVMTDRRTYNIDLVSAAGNYIPSVRFSYPQDNLTSWSSFIASQQIRRQQDAAIEAGSKSNVSSGEYSPNIENLNFNYKIVASTKNLAWKPLRVFDDGVKTYIQMPKTYRSHEAPVLLLYSGKTQKLVNYRVKGELYIIDRLIDTKAVLMAGGYRVSIVRSGK